ncbi:ABC transporter ATP-binding protein, partial [mine drainage metagenome]
MLSGDPLPQKSSRIFYPQVDPETSAQVRRDPPDMMDYTSAVDLWKSGRADRQAMIASGPLEILPTGARRMAFDTDALSTTHDFFPMFDVPFQYGGPWSAADDTARAQVAVISRSLNDRLFGGANSVGRMLPLAHGVVRIVGVLKHWRPAPLF